MFPPALAKELVYSSGISFIKVMQTAVCCIYLIRLHKYGSELEQIRVVIGLKGRTLKKIKFTFIGSG